jgi:hypothetical protein
MKKERPALAGLSFALSATGVKQRDLEEAIQKAGGTVSRTVHRRVDYLVATPLAIERNTKHVRKALHKFTHIRMVVPAFVHHSAAQGKICDSAEYLPTSAGNDTADSGVSTAEAAAAASTTTSPAVELVLPSEGDRIEVLVEMSDDPTLEWWPVQVRGSTPGVGGQPAYSIAYERLPARGYDDETPSRARFKLAKPSGAEEPTAPPGDGTLYDMDEGVWRPWRRLHPASGSAAPASAGPPAPSLVLASSLASASAAQTSHPRRTGRKGRRISLVRSPFKRTSAARAFFRARHTWPRWAMRIRA